jgi:hypothetical protein
MINFKVNTNLPEVIDYVNQITNDVQYIIVSAIEEGKEEIRADLNATFGIGYDDLNIEFLYEGGSYRLIVDGINQYQLYNNTGFDMDYLLNYIENKMLDKIQSNLNNAGYASGY